jgi:hypothetical protein
MRSANTLHAEAFSPSDRESGRKLGSKFHLLVDATGMPLTVG